MKKYGATSVTGAGGEMYSTPFVPHITMSFKLKSEIEANDSWHNVTGCDADLEVLMHALWETNAYVFKFSDKMSFDNVSPSE